LIPDPTHDIRVRPCIRYKVGLYKYQARRYGFRVVGKV
jgi:hypothetical protein